ncbi:beta strand repeat-containing protein, partial [Patescibacteria group bacterium]
DRFADNDHGGATDYDSTELVVSSADGNLDSGDTILVPGTADFTLFASTNDTLGFDIFADNSAGGGSEYEDGDDILRLIHNGSSGFSNGDGLVAFDTTDGSAEIFVDHGTDDDTYNDGEDILVQVTNGADSFSSPATLQALSANELAYYDDHAGSNGDYDDGEAIIVDTDTDGYPSSGDVVKTAGGAKVEALTTGDNVCFDGSGSGDDAEFDSGEIIWWDAAGDCSSFTSLTDVILVGGAAPTNTLTEFGTEQEVAFLDDNNDGSYTCTRAGTCEPLVWVSDTDFSDDDDLPTGTTFFDSSTEGTDGIATTGTGWDESGAAEDLNDFNAASGTYAYVGSGAYADGDDIFILVTDGGSATLSDGDEGRTFPTTDVYEDGDTSSDYSDGDDIYRTTTDGAGAAAGKNAYDFPGDNIFTDANNDGIYTDGEAIIDDDNTDNELDAGDTIITGGDADLNTLNGLDYRYCEDGSPNFDGTEAVVATDDADLETTDTVYLSGTCNLTNFPADHGYVEANANAYYDDGEDIYQDNDSSGYVDADTITDITVNNGGTVQNADLAGMFFYLESTDTVGFQAGEDDLIFGDTDGTYFSSAESFVSSPYPSATQGQRLYIAVDIAASPTHARTIDAVIPIDGIVLGSTDTGASDSAITNSDVGGVQTIDAQAPAIDYIDTEDQNGDGYVETFFVGFDEYLDDSTVANADFTVTSCTVGSATRTVTGVSISDEGGYEEVEITVTPDTGGSPSGDTDVLCDVNVVATASGIDDDYTNTSTSDSDTAEDFALPVVMEVLTDDTDDNGEIQVVDILFSEPVDDSTLGAGAGGWEVTGYTGDTVSTGASADDNLIRVTFTESGTLDTDATPNVAYTPGTLADDSTNSNTLAAYGATAAGDGASPVVVEAVTDDNDGDGKIDRIDIELSEPVDDSSLGAGAGGWDLSGYADDAIGTGASSDDAYIRLTFTQGAIYDTSGTPNLSYTPGTLEDGLSNTVGAYSPTATVDGAAPAVTDVWTEDNDGNGQIDRVEIDFSEPVDDSTLGAGAGGWDVAGYTGDAVETGDSADDNSIRVSFTESGTPDTGATPNVSYTPGTLTDDSGESNALAAYGAAAADDGANPAIIEGYYEDSDNNGTVETVVMIFSESVTGSTWEDGDWTVAEAGGITLLDESAGVLVNEYGTDDAISLTVTADTNETGVNAGTEPDISYTNQGTADSIQDSSGNPLATTTDFTLTDSAIPYIIDVNYLDDGFGDGVSQDGTVDSIDITFSEYVTVDECDDADWSITANAITGLTTDCADDFTAAGNATVIIAVDANSYITGTRSSSTSEPTLSYVQAGGTADSVHDGKSNYNEDMGPFTMDDLVKPVIFSPETDDNDGNGLIDRIYVEVSEDIDDGTLDNSDFTVEDLGTFGVYTVAGVADDDDGIITLTLTELSSGATTGDTGSTPRVTDNFGVFADTSTAANTSSGANPISSDGADPVVCTAAACTASVMRYLDNDEDGNVDSMEFIFSETVQPNAGEDTGSDGLCDGDEFDAYNDTESADATSETVSLHNTA